MISNTKLHSIQKLQNNALRLIDPYQKKIEKIYRDLEILNIKESIQVKNCKMAHKLEHNMLPGKLSQLFISDNKGRSLIKVHKYSKKMKRLVLSR